MGRVIFINNNQATFLRNTKLIYGITNNQLAVICQVSERTIRDWLRGKYTISEQSLFSLLRTFKMDVPAGLKIVDDFWYGIKGAKAGGLARVKLYGELGTRVGRVKGGVNSQLRRRENPEKYRLLNCNIRKSFKIENSSKDFAEVTGILLGDGCITKNQIKISLSSITDRPYADFVMSLLQKVFKYPSIKYVRAAKHTIVITLSGVELVEELSRWGFMKGSKVRQQITFPDWIWEDIELQKACVRGLMDTDGGCYFHKHKSNGIMYRNFGMCFTNFSIPIVESVAKVLKSLGLKISLANNRRQIYIYKIQDIKRYFEVIGSNNFKNNQKFKFYMSQISHRYRLGDRGWDAREA